MTAAPEEAAVQIEWLDEEIQQAKLCSTHLMVFSYHSWRVPLQVQAQAQAQAQSVAGTESGPGQGIGCEGLAGGQLSEEW